MGNGEVGKEKLGLQLLPFSVYTTYIARVPPSGFSRQREWEELPLKGNSPQPLDVNARAKLLKITKVGIGIFISSPEKGFS